MPEIEIIIQKRGRFEFPRGLTRMALPPALFDVFVSKWGGWEPTYVPEIVAQTHKNAGGSAIRV